MPALKQIPEHVQWMGTLIVNLQSLEFALRGFLYNDEKQWKNDGGPSFLDGIVKGQVLDENACTNFDTLGKLIDKYNSKVQSKSLDLRVDPAIARMRDALAHGRIAGVSPSTNEPLRLVKYDKPKKGFMCVTDYHVLTKQWFDEKGELIAKSIENVLQAMELFSTYNRSTVKERCP